MNHWLNGRVVAGADEAGRGAYAGPLSVGFVIFSAETLQNWPAPLSDTNDSKLLTAEDRARLAPEIKRFAEFHCVIHVSNRMIDKIGINPSTSFALQRAFKRAKVFGISTDVLLMDGNFRFPELESLVKVESIKFGDQKVRSIAAASILAKHSRDTRMSSFEKFYPGYELGSHKGYGTLTHRTAIDKLGPSKLHRLTYGRMDEPELFNLNMESTV